MRVHRIAVSACFERPAWACRRGLDAVQRSTLDTIILTGIMHDPYRVGFRETDAGGSH
jgi:hypothetical protein